MLERFERHDVEVDGTRIRALVGGDGPPVLLLHGYPQTHVMWHRLAPQLTGEQWREVLRANGDAWLRIATEPALAPDLYGARLGDLRVPVLVIHGGKDPRTEPGELDAFRDVLTRRAEALRRFEVLAEGGHSPHSERATADDVTRLAQGFVRELFSDSPALPAPTDTPALPDPPDPPPSPALPARRDPR